MTIPRFRLALPLGFVAAAAVPHAAAQSTPAARPKPSATVPAPAAAPVNASVRQIVVTAPSAIAYGCAADTCREITQLEKGTVLSVVKTDRDWYQVMVRVGATSMTTGWLKAKEVAATADAATRAPAAGGASASALGGPATQPVPAEEDPRGCLTCMATREPTRDEWNAALSETAKVKARPADPAVAPGIVDARPDADRMRERATQRYTEELTRLGKLAGDVDNGLRSYLALCVERFASIPVAGAAPRSTSVDDMLKAARATPGAARFAVWNGTAAFQWNDAWDPKPDPTSTLPSCSTIWEDARSRAERLKIDVEALERDAQEQHIFPGVVRDLLAAYNLAEPTQAAPTPLTDIR